jgi:hypothetical protein
VRGGEKEEAKNLNNKFTDRQYCEAINFFALAPAIPQSHRQRASESEIVLMSRVKKVRVGAGNEN